MKRFGQFLKLNIVAPIAAGILFGSPLFLWGEIDDAPGLCLIAIALCLGLSYWGLRNAAKINPYAKPSIVLPLTTGAVGLSWIAGYLISGVYDEPPGLIVGGLVTGIALVIFGSVNIGKLKKKLAAKSNQTTEL
jgi:hypothetical protein